MKKYITILVGLLALSETVLGQGSVTLGPDKVLPTCVSCDTLFATSIPPTVGAIDYNVTSIPYTPYSYTTGTPVPGSTTDDVWATVVQIPFPFCFYGNVYNQLVPSTNGTVSFDLANSVGGNTWAMTGIASLPNPTFADALNAIMCPYQDLLPNANTPVRTETFGTAPNRVFVISWGNTPMFSCTSQLVNQQIALYEGTNVIETYIANRPACAWNGNLAVHGTQNAMGTVAHIVPGRNLPTTWTTTNDAWRWTPTNTGGPGSPAPVVYEWTDLSTGNVIGGNVSELVVCPTVTTTYQIKAKWDLCGISDSAYDQITIIKQNPINIAISNIVDANCFGYNDGSFDMNVTGGGSPYNITSNGNPISNGLQSNLLANTYQIVVTDAYNCTNSTSVVVSEPTELQLSIVSQTDVLCKYQNTGTVHFTATGSVPGYEFWYNGVNKQLSPNFDTMRAGNFTFYVTDTHGCLDSMPVTVLQPDSILNVSQVAHEATCFSKKDGYVEAFASGGIPGYQYEWDTNPMQTGATATNLESGVYHVLVTDANGCITATQMEVEQQLCCQLFLPDAFTPNGDQKNDVYKINERGGGVILGEFRIYNRWGQEIFSTREMRNGWNGEYKGVAQSTDTYHYIVQYQCNDKGVISQKIAKGDFILIR